MVISPRLTGRLRWRRNPPRALFLPLPRRERTEVRVPIGLPPHLCLLPPGEKEPMAEALSVSKRNASYQPTRGACMITPVKNPDSWKKEHQAKESEEGN